MKKSPLLEECLEDSFSFEGEDRVCLSLLRKLIGQFNGDIFYLDIGCNDPIKFSNTYLFYKLGYRGICVDPLPISKEKFERHREKDIFINVAITDKNEEKDIQIYEENDATPLFNEVYDNVSTLDEKTRKSYSSRFAEKEKLKVKTKTLKTIFDELGFRDKMTIPLLSIDVEGFDEIVFKQALQINHEFEIIIIEDKLFNLTNSFPQSNISQLALDFGYILIGKSPLNSIYIRSKSKLFQWLPESIRTFKNN